MASPVVTFSPLWLRTMTSIRTQREFAVVCFDLTMPVAWMVSPGRTGRKVDAALNQNIENNPMQSRKGSLAWMLPAKTF